MMAAGTSSAARSGDLRTAAAAQITVASPASRAIWMANTGCTTTPCPFPTGWERTTAASTIQVPGAIANVARPNDAAATAAWAHRRRGSMRAIQTADTPHASPVAYVLATTAPTKPSNAVTRRSSRVLVASATTRNTAPRNGSGATSVMTWSCVGSPRHPAITRAAIAAAVRP